MAHASWLMDIQDYMQARACSCPRTKAHARKHVHKHTQMCFISCFSTATIMGKRASVLRYIVHTFTVLLFSTNQPTGLSNGSHRVLRVTKWILTNTNVGKLPFKQKMHCKSQACFFGSVMATYHFPSLYLLHFPTLCLNFSLHLPEGRTGTAWEPSEQYIFCFFL